MNTRPTAVFLAACLSLSALCGCRTVHQVAQRDLAAEKAFAEEQATLIRMELERLYGATAESRVQIGDMLTIQVWLADNRTQFSGFPRDEPVTDSGVVFVPQVGITKVAGRTDAEVVAELQKQFDRILQSSTVVVKHRRPNFELDREEAVQEAIHVTVMGRVGKPGLYKFVHGMTVRDAIARAGDLRQHANRRSIYLVRGSSDNPQILRVNMNKVLTGRDLSQNYVLTPNDAIYVAPTTMWKTADFISTLLLPVTAVRDAVWVYDRVAE